MAVYLCNECSSEFGCHCQLDQHIKRQHAASTDDSDPVNQPEQSVCDSCTCSTNTALCLWKPLDTNALCLTPSASLLEEVDKGNELVEDVILGPHVHIHTSEVDVYVCQTPNKDDFVVHEVTHNGSTQTKDQLSKQTAKRNIVEYQCEVCSSRFTRRDNLNVHIESQHTKNIVWHSCEMCLHRFNRKGNLKRHIKSQHTATAMEDIVWYSCEMCPQRFKQKGDFKRHMMRTHATKVYCCDRCPAVFGTDRDLEQHLHEHFKD